MLTLILPMKKLLYTLLATLLTGSAFSQAITLSSSPTVVVGKIDSCGVPSAAGLAALPSIAAATNASWDFTGVSLNPAPYTYKYIAKTAGFPSATLGIDSVTYALSASSPYSYKAWPNVLQSSTGVAILGEEILTRQAKGLGAATGNNLDSIIFPAQVMTFSAPLRTLKFLATYGTVWLDSAVRTLNINLTVALASLNNAPGQQRQKRIYLDSVVGWGRMKVPVFGKAGSAYIPVLQMHHTDTQIDSFFLNGSAASATVLGAFGASQGQINTVARTYFYRAGAFRPLIEAVHSSPSFSSGISKMFIHAVDVPEASAAVPYVAAGAFRAYPDPARAGSILHIDMQDASGTGWSYTLINVAGQALAAGLLPQLGAKRNADISLPQTLSAGVYYLTLKSASGEMYVLPLNIN